MKSVDQQITETQASLMGKGVSFATIQKLTESGTQEQKLSCLQQYKPQKIDRKNGAVQEAINESVSPSKIKVLETLIRNGFEEAEARILAGLDLNNPNQTSAERRFLQEAEAWSD